MKTFKQFREASSENLPPIITDLKKMAGSYKMDKKQATNLKNTIVGTVFNKLGGQEGIDKAVGKVDSTIKTMNAELPSAVNKFSDFLKSGKIEQGFEKMSSQIARAGTNNKKQVTNTQREVNKTPTPTST